MSMASNKNGIYASNIWKRYERLDVLRGLSIEIPGEKISIILGKSGVGKSVLLRLLCGLESPDTGEIFVNGRSLSTLTEAELQENAKDMGMLFQSSALFDSMTIAENVGFALENLISFALSPSAIKESIDTALQQVGLEGYQEKYPSELSGGQKRRAALARLIAYRPKILLFDEPTTGLDPITSRQIAALIKKTQTELGSTAVIVTHDIASALEIGDYFALHSEGKIVLAGEKSEFLTSKHPLLQDFLRSASV
jgi:phospholipid/cholesterol/gamma-HCH transport system ATP-binding protein